MVKLALQLIVCLLGITLNILPTSMHGHALVNIAAMCIK